MSPAETPPEQQPHPDRDQPGPRPRRALWTLVVWAVVYALDQVTKVLAVAHLEPGVVRPFVGQVLQFHLIRNPGAAFSFATGATWIFTVLAAVVVVVVVRMARKLRSLPWALAFGFLLAGATGNLTDRLLRQPGFARGHVVDFLQLPHWPIFNVADASICVAAVFIAVLAVRGVGLDGTRQTRETSTGGTSTGGTSTGGTSTGGTSTRGTSTGGEADRA